MTFHNVTFAMDLSLSSPGFAVIATTDDGEPIVLEVSHVLTDAKKPHGYRLEQIADEIGGYLDGYSPEYIVREKGFSMHARTTQALYKVIGVSDYITYATETRTIEEIAPTSVKKAVTGNGKSSKESVADAVFEQLRIKIKADFYTKKGVLIDDRTDACAVGLAYMKRKGLI